MAITVVCDHCQRSMKIKESFAGKTGRCPHCKQSISVPANIGAPPEEQNTLSRDASEEDELLPPTDKQLAYALGLGIDIPESIDRRDLSKLIATAKKPRPPTVKQEAFLRKLGIEPPEFVNFEEISQLIDSALDMEAKVTLAVSKRLESEWRETGQSMDHATDQQLLEELEQRDRPFCISLLDDDEFHYKADAQIKARLTWSTELSEDDVKFIYTSMAKNWANDFDVEEYAEEHDNNLPSFQVNVGELDEYEND